MTDGRASGGTTLAVFTAAFVMLAACTSSSASPSQSQTSAELNLEVVPATAAG